MKKITTEVPSKHFSHFAVNRPPSVCLACVCDTLDGRSLNQVLIVCLMTGDNIICNFSDDLSTLALLFYPMMD